MCHRHKETRAPSEIRTNAIIIALLLRAKAGVFENCCRSRTHQEMFRAALLALDRETMIYGKYILCDFSPCTRHRAFSRRRPAFLFAHRRTRTSDSTPTPAPPPHDLIPFLLILVHVWLLYASSLSCSSTGHCDNNGTMAKDMLPCMPLTRRDLTTSDDDIQGRDRHEDIF